MKKKISILLITAIIISMFTLFSYAADTKTDKLFAKITESTEVSVTLTAGNTLLGSSTDTFRIKGNNAVYDYNSGFLSVRVLVKDGAAYAYLTSLPFFYVKLDNTGLISLDLQQLIKTASGLTQGITQYSKTYEETVDGTTYTVEEYNDRAQVIIKYCYVGDTLKLLRVIDARTNSIQNTYFENISFTVDDSLFSVPTGINLTPFLKGIFTALIASAI